ncbi:ferredoxin [Kutzneria kofuensis]|jgi:ferredoxin|uniref:Ferredoxin n=1 Tax=Kutzneria kofuensis TaxID=103725 RepID=A0A7W9KQA7_9PSEU|nr:ferredoxin [Kutzneria kofuensis]MBB5896773.1 ferredoxin [Kutzneria kofuensis]
MRIQVDTERCMGHGMCNALAPEVYEVTDEGFNEMGVVDVPDHLRDAAFRGANACPERIIALLDTESA